MDYINDLLKQLLNAKSEMLVAILCLVAGYVCRKIKVFPNRYIPLLTLVVGAIAYPLLVPTGEVSYETRFPAVRCVIIGLIIGFGVWTLHKAALKPLEAKFPWLTNFLDGSTGDSNPEAFKKTDTKPNE